MSRFIVLRVALLLMVVVLVGRLYQLQIVESDTQRYGNDIEVTTSRKLIVPPRRGEILAADGQTLLARSLPIYNIALVPGRLPSQTAEPERRTEILGRLTQIAELTSTLTLSPTSILDTRPALRGDLEQLGPLPPISATQPLTVTVAPNAVFQAITLSQTYSDVLSLNNPLEELLAEGDVRRYQTLIVKEDISPELALVIRENSNYLPGVMVVEGFRRSYPQSSAVPSLSHLLGYIGRVTECELTSENPASSWLNGLSEVIMHAGPCGLIAKKLEPTSIGLPPYTGDDRIGKDGLEAAYETELRGRMGIDTLLVDAMERPVSAPTALRPVEHGNNLVLTIDVKFQAQVEKILRRWILEGERRRNAAKEQYKRDYKPIRNGVAVVLNPRDGRILAMVSVPNYDNNVWVDPTRVNDLRALLAPSAPQAQEELQRLAPLTNRAIAGQYPPGSTLKQFVGSVALQTGTITVDTKLHDPGLIRLIERNGSTFILPNSVRNRDNGQINVVDALRLSSNVFFASVAGGNDQVINLGKDDYRTPGVGIDNLVTGLEWFNLGRLTGVDLAGEAPGLVPTKTWKAQTLRDAWTTGDTYNTAIGQGYMEVTPLQLATAAGGIATDGSIYKPHMVQAITDANGNVVRTITPELKTKVPIDPAYLALIRQGMRESVVNGLNIAARDECSGLSIAGKTGTAEFGPNLAPEGRRQSHSWFVGFAPFDNPQLVVAVLLEGTGDLSDGSSTMAVPAVTQIMQAYFGVTPPEERPRTCPLLPTDDPDLSVPDIAAAANP